MERDIDKVIEYLKGNRRISDIKVRGNGIFTFRYDDNNPDFVRNNFHVLARVMYVEHVADWKGNIVNNLYISVAIGTRQEGGYNDRFADSRRDYYQKLCNDTFKHPCPGYVNYDVDISNGQFSEYERKDIDYSKTKCIGLVGSFGSDYMSGFKFTTEKEIYEYIGRVVTLLFRPAENEKTMEFMFRLGKFYLVPAPVTNNAN